MAKPPNPESAAVIQGSKRAARSAAANQSSESMSTPTHQLDESLGSGSGRPPAPDALVVPHLRRSCHGSPRIRRPSVARPPDEWAAMFSMATRHSRRRRVWRLTDVLFQPIESSSHPCHVARRPRSSLPRPCCPVTGVFFRVRGVETRRGRARFTGLRARRARRQR